MAAAVLNLNKFTEFTTNNNTTRKTSTWKKIKNETQNSYNKIISHITIENIDFSLSISEKVISGAKSIHKFACIVFKDILDSKIYADLSAIGPVITVIGLGATSLIFTPWTCYKIYERIIKFGQSIKRRDKEGIIDHVFGFIGDIKSLADKAKLIGGSLASVGWIVDQSHWIASLNIVTIVLGIPGLCKSVIDAVRSVYAKSAFDKVIANKEDDAKFDAILDYVGYTESTSTPQLTSKNASRLFKKDIKWIRTCLTNIEKGGSAEDKSKAAKLLQWRARVTICSNIATPIISAVGIAISIISLTSAPPIGLLVASITMVTIGITKVCVDYFTKRYFIKTLEEMSNRTLLYNINNTRDSEEPRVHFIDDTESFYLNKLFDDNFDSNQAPEGDSSHYALDLSIIEDYSPTNLVYQN